MVGVSILFCSLGLDCVFCLFYFPPKIFAHDLEFGSLDAI